MEIIKRKILLENNTDRNYNSPTYGQVTASTFYVNIMLTQNFDDMGMFTDVYYIPNVGDNAKNVDYSILKDKLLLNGITFPFMNNQTPSFTETTINPYSRIIGKPDSEYYSKINKLVTGYTESRIDDVTSYDNNQPYKVGFDMASETYINYSGGTVNGASRVISINPTAFTYVIDANKNDPNIGTLNQKDGLLFIEKENEDPAFISYIGQGWNQTNTSVSALTKEEYLFGIISRPEIQSDVFIDRGIVTFYEKHLKMSEITNLTQLERYGNGYFNVSAI